LRDEEEAFVHKIEAQPADRSIRRAYADWLDQVGDQRAELIRIEEEMRSLPFYSDHYWELKPRRNLLREQTYAEWLRRMKFGEDHEPVVRDIPSGWRERWRLLREFTERWYGLPMADVGGGSGEIGKTEAALGLRLPPAMREWIAYCFDLGDYFVDVLRDCYDVIALKDLSSVSLMISGEEDSYWAVKNDDLATDDPPVDLYFLDYTTKRFIYKRLFAPRVTSFVFQHMITYLSACAPGGDVSKVVSYEDNESARVFLRYLTDVFLGSEHPLPQPY
jgi:uncharacterized protein (TIGR02996 family)